jgi:hypothetical protein
VGGEGRGKGAGREGRWCANRVVGCCPLARWLDLRAGVCFIVNATVWLYTYRARERARQGLYRNALVMAPILPVCSCDRFPFGLVCPFAHRRSQAGKRW